MNPYMWHPFEVLADTPYLAVFVAIIVVNILGMVWYNYRVFGTAWMHAAGLKNKDLEGEKGKKAMLWNIPISILLAMHVATLYVFIGGHTLVAGLFTGAVSARVVILFMAMHYLFEQKPLKLFLINAGFTLVSLLTMGAVIGLMS